MTRSTASFLSRFSGTLFQQTDESLVTPTFQATLPTIILPDKQDRTRYENGISAKVDAIDQGWLQYCKPPSMIKQVTLATTLS